MRHNWVTGPTGARSCFTVVILIRIVNWHRKAFGRSDRKKRLSHYIGLYFLRCNKTYISEKLIISPKLISSWRHTCRQYSLPICKWYADPNSTYSLETQKVRHLVPDCISPNLWLVPPKPKVLKFGFLTASLMLHWNFSWRLFMKEFSNTSIAFLLSMHNFNLKFSI